MRPTIGLHVYKSDVARPLAFQAHTAVSKWCLNLVFHCSRLFFIVGGAMAHQGRGYDPSD